MTKEKIVWDIEATNLLDESSIDYTCSPYKLRESYRMHCIVVIDKRSDEIIAFYDGTKYILDGRKYEEQIEGQTYLLEGYESIEYTHYQLKDFPQYIKENVKNVQVVAHNQINYDLLACKLYFGMDYKIGQGMDIEDDEWFGNPVEIVDTLVKSKTLNPDRFGGHSLDSLSEKTGIRKVAFRKHMHESIRFEHFAADMLYYNIYDVKSNDVVDDYLNQEWEGWDWGNAFTLEKQVADIITRQSHRGFWFNKDLAHKNLAELDELMEDRRARVEPVLPKRKATQAFMKEYTPPKNQVKQDGKLSAHMLKFLEKHKGVHNVFDDTVTIFDKEYSVPMPPEPIITEMDATIDDTTHIKEWLVHLGWSPSEYKEKDLSCDTKKQKLSPEKYKAAVERYVAQTLDSSFCADRCEHLNMKPRDLMYKLLNVKGNRAVKVLTNPSFTKGQDKEMCPDLERIAEKFPYAKDVVEYLTYKHRRNSILGGGQDWEDEEEPEKGYLASVRQDNRIPTPADTCGAATSRMKHRSVANIPRVTSLYGHNMREMFGVEQGFYQIGYDFDSLEAREEAHYCWKYEDGDRAYCQSLLQDKPNDVHTMMAKKITGIIGRTFARGPAKNVKYGCTYGAQAAKVAKTIGSDLKTGEEIFTAFWEAAYPLAELKERLKKYWETVGQKKFILGIDGRKVPTRSAHAILNSLFQSAGVICAKRAMVIHDIKLKEEGFSVDFFMEDWKNKQFCQQLIAYHDEAQTEVSKSLVKFKMFKTKEEAQAFKDEQTITWSDIKDSPKGGVYVAYSRPGELATEAVYEAGRYYKLNVDLTAGYIVEKSWAGCH